MQLNYFAEQANKLGHNAPVFLFGDCNMKHRTYMIDRPMYDEALLKMYFSGDKLAPPIQNDYLGYLSGIHRELLSFESQWHKLQQQHLGVAVALHLKAKLMEQLSPDARTCARLGLRADELNLQVYTSAPGTGSQHGAKSALFNRGKHLWTLPTVTGMTAHVSGKVEDSSLMGGVIDQVFYRGAKLVGYQIVEDRHIMDKKSKPGLSEFTAFDASTPFPEIAKTIFASGERIKASDHFPVMANFVV